MIIVAFLDLTYWLSKPPVQSISTLGICLTEFRIISTRSSMVNKEFLFGLVLTAIINLSTNRLPRSKMSTCPFVTGSKLPGHTPIRTGLAPFSCVYKIGNHRITKFLFFYTFP